MSFQQHDLSLEKEVTSNVSKPAAVFEDSTPETSLGPALQPTTSTASEYGARPKCFNSLLAECLFVVTTAFAVGQSSMLLGALMVMSAKVQEDLNMSSSETTWLVAGINLTSGSFLLFFGRVADLFGRRNILIGSMGSFTICMLITGFSQNAIMALVFLAVSGITCASVVPPAIGKLGAIYDKPSFRKNRAFACFSAGNPVCFCISMIASGIATNIASWRAPFWVLTVIYGVLTVVAWFTTPADSEQNLGGFNRATLKQMDWLGALLAVAGIALFTTAFTMAPDASHGWATASVIAMLIVGVFLIGAFLYWQSVFKYPLMPLRVWKDRNFSLLVAALCLGFYGFNQNFFWMGLGWQRSYHNSSLEVAVKMLPSAIGGLAVNVLAALIMHRVSNKVLSIFAAFCTAAASALLSATSKNISYWALFFPAQLLSVLGADFAFCVTNLYVMSSLPSEQQSVAGGMFQTATRLASTVGLGISTTVFASVGGSTEASGDIPWRPYQATFWTSVVGAVLGLALTPFLTIGRQGHRQKAKVPSNEHEVEDLQESKRSVDVV